MMKRRALRCEAAGLATRMLIVYRAIDQLTPDPANPRRHSKKQIRQIANSIEAFGFNVPILIDRDDKVIAGHGRLLACRELGWSEVPTLRLDHLTPAQARAYMIADNRLTSAPDGPPRPQSDVTLAGRQSTTGAPKWMSMGSSRGGATRATTAGL